MRETVLRIVSSREWEAFIISLILVNAVLLGLMTSGTAMAAAGGFLLVLDQIIIAIFTVEIALRIYAHRAAFFRDPWSLFDLFVVAIALVPATQGFAVLRALRVLRILRLVSMVPQLRRVVTGLITALPGMGSIVLLMAIIFYVFSVMATSLYGATFPEWFGTMGASAYTLFQVMTLESWSMGIVRPVMEVYPYAWMFFVPFIAATAFTVLNLFIGVIVSAMQAEVESEAAEDRKALHEEQLSIEREVKAIRGELAAVREMLAGLVREAGPGSAGPGAIGAVEPPASPER